MLCYLGGGPPSSFRRRPGGSQGGFARQESAQGKKPGSWNRGDSRLGWKSTPYDSIKMLKLPASYFRFGLVIRRMLVGSTSFEIHGSLFSSGVGKRMTFPGTSKTTNKRLEEEWSVAARLLPTLNVAAKK